VAKSAPSSRPMGPGKAFFSCLTGILRPSAGRILFNREDITGLSPDRFSRKGIARSYQITNILPNATTLENVRIAAQSRRHGWSMLAWASRFRGSIRHGRIHHRAGTAAASYSAHSSALPTPWESSGLIAAAIFIAFSNPTPQSG
jgi:ABC-type branched-subunit amino acid transport system ATPase component